ncbi:plasmid mobilization protein [Flavobacterium xinjiangense]|uniref:Mobilisation protein (MobC) n=1 Tax=Flavobacterium xinjiangense TaxID=178356 RepID=A0A1M7P5Z6_9FLAO|nr:mobilization protein [Flavobacterium xinjiangense]SHN12055.1 hypothetical protein SAMN05216269_11422 [Flavobacterium xinjiangense]
MMKEKNNRTKWFHLRLTPDEYQKIMKEFNKSTCRKLSDYARKNLLQKPIVNTYRNQSQDDFMAEMIRLRVELNAIGNNFNQAVKKLHTLHQIADFKHWLLSYELEKKILFNKVDEIKKHIQKFAESWLQ